MNEFILRVVESAVRPLGVLALGLAFVVYFLMEIYHRRQIARGARRLMLSSKLFPPLSGDALRALWSRSGEVDRELIEDILVDVCRSADSHTRKVVEQSILKAGIFERWMRELRHRRISRRVRAAMRLGYVSGARGVYELTRAANDPSDDVKLAVTLSLGRLRDARGLSGLLRIASKPVKEIPDLTLAAALAACAEKSPGGLASLLLGRQTRQRVVGAWALSEVADKTCLRYLLQASKDPEPEVRAKVARALVRIPGQESADALRRLALDPIWFVRVRALDALGRLKTPLGEDAVFSGLKDQVREVRCRAAFALRNIEGMKGDLVTKVLSTQPRASFESMISEWDQAGFIWEVVSGLSTHDFPRFSESQATLKTLIAAGIVRSLANLILVFPDVKVRLRLLRLFLEAPSREARAELLALADQPKCDRRVVAAIRRAFPAPNTRLAVGVRPSVV
jgi:HEAT repeat protein